MGGVSEDPDYLVRTKPEVNPHSFEEVVQEAFLLEHDCRQRIEIAKILGVTKGRVSQILRHPEKLKLDTIQLILDCLGESEQRRRIVRSWAIACFGEDIEVTSDRRLAGEIATSRTLKRVDRQIRESRLSAAAQIAEESASTTDDWSLKQRFLDRAYFAHQRLDQPGQAVRIARLILESAGREGDKARMAAGHLLRARIMLGTFTVSPSEFDRILCQAESLVQASEVVRTGEPYLVCTPELIANLREGASLEFMRRGQIPVDAQAVEAIVQRHRELVKPGNPYRKRFHSHLLLANCFLLLGNPFAAAEHLDATYRSGGIKNLQVYETCGVVKGRIFAQTESAEVASIHLRHLSGNCRKSQDLYHRRLAELDLAAIESELMSGPRSAEGLGTE